MEQEKYFLGIENTPHFDFKRMTELCAKSKTKTLLRYLIKLESTVQDASCQYARERTAASLDTYENSVMWLANLNKEVSGRIENKKKFLMKYARKNKYTKLNERIEKHINYFESCKVAWQKHCVKRTVNQNQQSMQPEDSVERSSIQEHTGMPQHTSIKERTDIPQLASIKEHTGKPRHTNIQEHTGIPQLASIQEHASIPQHRSTQEHLSAFYHQSEQPKKQNDLRNILHRSDSRVARETVILHGKVVRELQSRQEASTARSVDSGSR